MNLLAQWTKEAKRKRLSYEGLKKHLYHDIVVGYNERKHLTLDINKGVVYAPTVYIECIDCNEILVMRKKTKG